MTNEREAPGASGGSQAGAGRQIQHAKDTTKPRKWRRVLAALLSGRSYHRFEAERELHDHCLHSSVSGLEARGIAILRHEEAVPGYLNIPTRVMRYRLDPRPENMEKARRVLGYPEGPQGAQVASRSRESATDVGEHVQGLDRARTQP